MKTTGRLVIAEDEPLLRAWSADVLRRAGYEICARVSDGPAAVRESLQHRPDLLLLDVQLADGTDGIATWQEIRSRSGTPVLFVTAHSGRANAAGAGAHCLQKPYTEAELVAAVARGLANARREPAKRESAPATSFVPAEGVARFKGAFEHAHYGIAIVGLDGYVVDVNARFAGLFDGISGASAPWVLRDRLELPATFEVGLAACLAGERDEVEAHEITVGERHRTLSAALVRGTAGEPRFAVVHAYDVTEQRQREAELRHRALHDPLTNLPNRELLHERLRGLLETEDPRLKRAALMMIDLDGFKAVNDRHGHGAGDLVLETIAERLCRRLRREDLLARLGGDEFAVLLPETDPEDAVAVARALEEQIAAPIQMDEAFASVGASLGVTVLGGAGEEPLDALARADDALYRAKARGGGVEFEPAGGGAPGPSAAALTAALESDAFVWRLAPRLDLARGTIVAADVTIFWTPAGAAEPLDLAGIARLAERFGLTETLFRTLVAGCRDLLDGLAGVPEPRLVLSLAPFNDRATSLELLAGSLAPDLAARLELELGSAVWAAGHDVRTQRAVARCRTLGASLTLDGMGVDLAQWWRLRNLAVDRIKLAPRVVAELGRDARADAVLRAVAELGASFGFEVVADGVTTARQRRHLERSPVRYAQGPGLATALTPAAFRAAVATGGAPMATGWPRADGVRLEAPSTLA